MGWLSKKWKQIKSWLEPSEPDPQGVNVEKSGTNQAVPIIYGFQKKAPSIKVFKVTTDKAGGAINEYLHFICVFAVGEIEEIGQLYFNEVPESQIDNERYFVRRFIGSDTQGHCSELSAEFNQWQSSAKLKNVAYAYVRLKQNDKVNWWNGEPSISADIKGLKVLDPRDGLVKYSDNAALCTLDYLINPNYGKGLSLTKINTNSFADEANFIETIRTYNKTVYRTFFDDENRAWQKVPVGTEQEVVMENLMSCNVSLDAENTIKKNVEILLSGMRATLPETNGKYRLGIEKAGASSFAFTKENLIGAIQCQGGSQSDRYNQVIVKFRNKLTGEEDEAVFPEDDLLHQTWKAEDSGKLLLGEFDGKTIDNKAEALQMGHIIAHRSRELLGALFTGTPETLVVEAGDIVSLNSQIMGWSNKPFRIESVDIDLETGRVDFQGVEHQNTLYPWAVDDVTEEYADTYFALPTDIKPVENLTFTEVLNDNLKQFRLRWDDARNTAVTKYIVEIYSGAALIQSSDCIESFYDVFGLLIGNHTFKVYAVNSYVTSAAASLSLNVSEPPIPLLSFETSNFELQVKPQIIGSYFGVKFELLVNTTNDFASAVNKGTAGSFTLVGLSPATTYYFWAKTINAVGASGWSEVISATTTSDKTDLENLLGASDVRYTWTVYSDKNDGTAIFYATNSPKRKYQGRLFNMPTEQPADLSGEAANHAFYDWRTLEVANLAEITRDLGSITSGLITGAQFQTATTGKRVVLNNADIPMQIWNDASELVFAVDGIGNLEFSGSLGKGSIKSKDDFDSGFWNTMFPPIQDASGGSADAALSSTIDSFFITVATLPNGNDAAPSVSVNFSDSVRTPFQKTPTDCTNPVWTLTIKRRINSGTWFIVTGYSGKQYTGTSSNNFDPEPLVPEPYWGNADISINEGFTDTGLVAVEGDKIEYEFTLAYVSGTQSASKAKLTAASITQPYQGGTGAVVWGEVSNKPSTRDGYNITDVYTKTEVDSKVLGMVKTTIANAFTAIQNFASRIDINGAGSWAYTRLKNGSAILWDIASSPADLSGALQWRPAGQTTNRMSLSTSGQLNMTSLKIGSALGSFTGNSSYTMFNGGNLYIQTGVPNCYLYAATTWLGNSSGCTIRARANRMYGDAWDISTGGVFTAYSFSSVNTGSSWISQKDSSAVPFRSDSAVSTASYAALARQKHASHTYTIGGLGNYYFGFFSYLNTRTANGTDGYFRMDVYGNCQARGTIVGADVTATSDINLKTNIKTLKNASAIRRAIRGTTNNRIDMDNLCHASPIAQEVEKVFPVAIQITDYEGNDKHGHKMKSKKTIMQSPVNALLIQSANDDYDHFERENTILKKRIAKIEKLMGKAANNGAS